MSNAIPVIRQADEGERFWFAGGGVFTMKATSAETGGSFAMWEDHVVRGKTTPLHVHPDLDEAIYMLEGEILVHVDGEEHRVGEGGLFVAPRGLPHAFRVVGPDPARFLALTFPGGLENLYEEIGRPAPGPGLPNAPTQEEIAAWLQTSTKYGLELNGPPLPDTQS